MAAVSCAEAGRTSRPFYAARMADRVSDWVRLVDDLYPESDAEAWDAPGLQVGDPDATVTTVLVSLDVTPEVVEEAVSVGAELVVAHHPLLLRPLERLTPATASGRVALAAARAGVAVVGAHTNFDVADTGTTEPIVAALGLVDVRPLQHLRGGNGGMKLVTFVPTESTAAVIDAVAGAGAGVIGEYGECIFRVRGTGTFRPSQAADPAVGERGQRNEVAEDRVETVVAASRVPAVVAALLAAHPYEEVAYDLVPLAAPPSGRGLGRVGRLVEPLPLGAVADRLSDRLPSPHLRVAGDLDRQVRRVAACGGAGDSLIGAALTAGADVYVTGDLRHHVTLDARTQGLALIDAGHYATEVAALPLLRTALTEAATDRGLTGRLLASAVSTEPWVQYRREATT